MRKDGMLMYNQSTLTSEGISMHMKNTDSSKTREIYFYLMHLKIIQHNFCLRKIERKNEIRKKVDFYLLVCNRKKSTTN